MDRREQMRRWLARRERQGLTFRELSKETGVPIGTLACWAWKLRREEADRSSLQDQGRGFVELVPKEGEAVGRIEIVLGSGRRVVIAEEFDEERLVRVVRALERC